MTLEHRLQLARKAKRTWDPVHGGRAAFIHWNDHRLVNLGEDPDGARFREISARMLSGRYYPDEAVQFHGDFRKEGRDLRAGDRIAQFAPIALGAGAWSVAEIYVATRTDDFCQIGYVTTNRHHGKGKWTCTLRRLGGALELEVEGIAMPYSPWFWLGLPVARYLMKRAWRLGIARQRSS
jgi:hypothetical protein